MAATVSREGVTGPAAALARCGVVTSLRRPNTGRGRSCSMISACSQNPARPVLCLCRVGLGAGNTISQKNGLEDSAHTQYHLTRKKRIIACEFVRATTATTAGTVHARIAADRQLDQRRHMGFLAGKRLLITGVLSNRSIAYGIARACRAQGAELAFSLRGRTLHATASPSSPREFDSKLVFDCDVVRRRADHGAVRGAGQRLAAVRRLRALDRLCAARSHRRATSWKA